MPPSEADGEGLSSQGESGGGGEEAGGPPLVRRAGVQVRRRARRAGVIQRES